MPRPPSIRIALVFAAAIAVTTPLGAQGPPPPATILQPAPPPETMPQPGPPLATIPLPTVPMASRKLVSERNVLIEVTITFKASPKPSIKTLSLVAADGRQASGRANIEIPVASSTAPGSQVRYRTVGFNVDANAAIQASGRIAVELKMNFSTVYKPGEGEPQQPSFSNNSLESGTIVFEDAKPIVVTKTTDSESGREYTVEAKATILK